MTSFAHAVDARPAARGVQTTPAKHGHLGTYAQVPLEECTINLEAGNPLLYEDYWVRHPNPALIMQPSAHMGYMTAYSPLPRLLAGIQNVHSMVGLLSHAPASCLSLLGILR